MFEAREGPRVEVGPGEGRLGLQPLAVLPLEIWLRISPELILSMEGTRGCYGVGIVWKMWEPL